jgi:endonuclease III
MSNGSSSARSSFSSSSSSAAGSHVWVGSMRLASSQMRLVAIALISSASADPDPCGLASTIGVMIAPERERAIAEALIAFGRSAGPAQFVPNDLEADKLLRENSFAMLLGILAQQHRTRAERAWRVPSRVRSHLGHLDPLRIRDQAELERILRKRTARIVAEAARRVRERWNGDAASIWGERDPAIIRSRLLAFHGAGPKIANMAPIILRRVGVDVAPGGGIAVDVHVRRVFRRLGLAAWSSSNREIEDAASRIWPDDPAALDTGTWSLGRTVCTKRRWNCAGCPLRELCPSVEEAVLHAGRSRVGSTLATDHR